MAEFVVWGVPGSPYTRCALLGLEEKGVAYELKALPLGAWKDAEHLKRHPFARIPVLDHGAFRLYESQAILRYLDSVLPRPALQPTDPRQLARMNQVTGIADAYLFDDVTIPISAERYRKPLFGLTPDEEVVKAAIPKARICIEELDRLLGEQPYFAGDNVSIADLMVGPQLLIFARTPEGQDMLKGTRLSRWVERMSARPSVIATERDRLLERLAA
jgi:glutathione S-transferase